MNMSAETCSALTAVFPLITIALVLERGNLPSTFRKHPRFRQITEYATLSSMIGLGFAIIGVQLGGLSDGWAVTAWILCAVSVVTFALCLLLMLINAEAAEDREERQGS